MLCCSVVNVVVVCVCVCREHMHGSILSPCPFIRFYVLDMLSSFSRFVLQGVDCTSEPEAITAAT